MHKSQKMQDKKINQSLFIVKMDLSGIVNIIQSSKFSWLPISYLIPGLGAWYKVWGRTLTLKVPTLFLECTMLT